MVSRNTSSDPDQREFAASGVADDRHRVHAERRTTTRSDPSLRDGDSGHGNPYEGGDAGGTDSDVGDSWEAEPLALSSGGELTSSADDVDDDTAAGAEVPLFRVPVAGVFAAAAVPVASADAADEPADDEPDDAEELRRLDPNRDLPIPHYAQLTIPEILTKVLRISPIDVVRIRDYEVATRNRKTLVERLARIVRGDGRKRKKQHAHNAAD